MLRSRAIALALSLCLAVPAGAQVIPVYGVLVRPPGVRYEVLRSRHFEVIHQVGTAAEAADLAGILEDALGSVSALFPIRDGFHMPVVLSRYTDRGNGYVSPIPFRQEIDAVPYAGLGVSPRHESWLETVGPHELVHAVHADFGAGFGIGGIVRAFAPDMARAMNLWVPPGIAEGSAIYVESRRGAGAGRLHYGYALMQYRAAAGSGNAWNLAQALERPVYTRPTDRQYVGGGPFVDWFVGQYGADVFRKVTRVHNRFPVFGYGFSMWIATGRPPWSVGRAFRRHATETEQAYREAEGLFDSGAPLSAGVGMVHRRPRWLDDGTLLVFMTAYDRERGLYRVDAGTGRLRAVAHQELSSDLQFAVRDTEPRASFSRTLVNRFTALQHGADLFTVDLETGRTTRLTHEAHLLYPAPLPGGDYLAVRVSDRGGPIVRVSGDGTVTPVLSDPDLRMVGLDVDQVSGRILVVANRYGSQGLWELDLERATGPSLAFMAGLRDGAVLDAAWAPGGDWVVFSADVRGKLDVYAYDTGSGDVIRLTRSVYGAMEPAVSPDGSRIAYVRYGRERFDLVVRPFEPYAGDPVARMDISGPADLPERLRRVAPESLWVDPVARPYRPARHLAPRMVYPMFYYEDTPGYGWDADLGIGAGLGIQGADPLLKWSYWGEGYLRKGRLWGGLGLMTSTVVVRPVLWLYDRPEAVNVRVATDTGYGTRRVIREERGAAMGIQLPVVLSDNVRSTTLFSGAGIRYEEQRLYDGAMQPMGDFTGRLTSTGSVSLGLGVQRNLRDLAPNRGLVLSAAGEADLHAGGHRLRRAAIASASLYLPWLSRLNVGLRLHAGWVGQSEIAVYDLDRFMPRGQEDLLPEWRSIVRVGAETIVPLIYADNGMLILPIYVASVYAYGFSEAILDARVLRDPGSFPDADRISSFGGGLGIQLRLFHVLDFDLRVGAARRVNRDDWAVIFR